MATEKQRAWADRLMNIALKRPDAWKEFCRITKMERSWGFDSTRPELYGPEFWVRLDMDQRDDVLYAIGVLTKVTGIKTKSTPKKGTKRAQMLEQVQQALGLDE